MAKEGPGYIYIISLAPMGLPGYKIGETTNLSRRLKQLKVPSHATKVHTFKVSKRLAAEKAAHRLYPNLRVPQSEWFKISEQQMERVALFIRRRFTQPVTPTKVVTAQWSPGDLDSSYPSSSFKPASQRCKPPVGWQQTPVTKVPDKTNSVELDLGWLYPILGGAVISFLLVMAGVASTAYSEFAPSNAPHIDLTTPR
jgi:hypothetical protein